MPGGSKKQAKTPCWVFIHKPGPQGPANLNRKIDIANLSVEGFEGLRWYEKEGWLTSDRQKFGGILRTLVGPVAVDQVMKFSAVRALLLTGHRDEEIPAAIDKGAEVKFEPSRPMRVDGQYNFSSRNIAHIDREIKPSLLGCSLSNDDAMRLFEAVLKSSEEKPTENPNEAHSNVIKLLQKGFCRDDRHDDEIKSKNLVLIDTALRISNHLNHVAGYLSTHKKTKGNDPQLVALKEAANAAVKFAEKVLASPVNNENESRYGAGLAKLITAGSEACKMPRSDITFRQGYKTYYGVTRSNVPKCKSWLETFDNNENLIKSLKNNGLDKAVGALAASKASAPERHFGSKPGFNCSTTFFKSTGSADPGSDPAPPAGGAGNAGGGP